MRHSLLLILLVLCFMAGPARHALAEAAPARMTASEIDRALDETLAKERYSWRVDQRVVPPFGGSSVIGELLRQFGKSIVDLLELIFKGLGKFFDWVGRLFHKDSDDVGIHAPANLQDWILGGAWLLLAASACFLGVWAWRAWRKAGGEGLAQLTELKPERPDLASEELSGSEVPVDEWRRMGSEAMARGEYRLAMRAYYLSSLGELAARQWLQLKKSRTGQEYQLELKRKAPQKAELHELFRGLSFSFERAWYGQWQVLKDDAERYGASLERLGGLAS